MKDEDKSKERLIRELQSLRNQLAELKGKTEGGERGGAPPVSDDQASFAAPDFSSDLVWDHGDFNTPMLDDSGYFSDSPRLLYVKGDSEPVEEPAGIFEVTDTGSYDLTWISIRSFGKLLNAIPMPVLLSNTSGRILFENHAFTTISGQHFPMEGESFYSLFNSEEEAENARGLTERVLNKRVPQEREGIIAVNEKEIWTRMHLRSIRMGGERSILVLIEDLTTEKRELTLNEKYKKLVLTFPIGIAEFSLRPAVSRTLSEEEILSAIMDSRIVGGNECFALLSGYGEADAVKGLPLRKLLPSTQDELQPYRVWSREGCSMHHFETKERMPDGTLRYFETTLVGNVQEDLLGQFWVMKQDMTEQKKIQADLEQKIATIDQLYEHLVQKGKAEAIAEHTATVAHELRQPLAIIGGFARRMSRECSPCPGNADGSKLQWFEVIVKEVQRLENILGGLIDFSKRDDVSVKRVSPNDIIEYVLSINRERMVEKNLCLKLNIGPETGDIPLDPDGFSHVVRNLVANAIEASPPDESISVETGVTMPSAKAMQTGELAAAAYFVMKIRNRGKPVPREHLEKIFNPFFTTKDRGTGLGLTLSKKIVEDHGGSISVKSDEECTILTVWLPTG